MKLCSYGVNNDNETQKTPKQNFKSASLFLYSSSTQLLMITVISLFGVFTQKSFSSAVFVVFVRRVYFKYTLI